MNEIQTNKKNVNSVILHAFNNCIKCSHDPAEKSNHRLTKFYLADYCYKRNLSFATEVTFKDNSRADFVIKDWGLILEVLSSESIKDFLKKKYPLPTIPITTNLKVINYDLSAMLEDLGSTNGKTWEYYYKKFIGE